MNNSIDILTLLGIDSEIVKSTQLISGEGNQTTLYIKLKDLRGFCPYCGSINISIKDYYETEINDSIVKLKNLYVRVRNRRYKCNKCGKTFKQETNIYKKKARISRLMEVDILNDLKTFKTFSEVAKEHGISVTEVVNIFDRKTKEIPLRLPKVLCIDELYFLHDKDKENKYICVLSNGENGDIVDIIYSRKKAYLYEYFSKLKFDNMQNVKYFVSDMNDTYKNIHTHFFKNSYYVIDTFHVVKLFTNAIQIIRKRLLKNNELETAEYKYLKKNWKIFLKKGSELKKIKIIDKNGVVKDPTIQLMDCLRKYPELFEAYMLKEDFLDYTKKQNLSEATNFINFFLDRMEISSIPEIKNIYFTIIKWEYPIIAGFCRNSYGLNVTNAMAEENNNRIRKLFGISYGYHSFARARERILYIDRNKKLGRNTT